MKKLRYKINKIIILILSYYHMQLNKIITIHYSCRSLAYNRHTRYLYALNKFYNQYVRQCNLIYLKYSGEYQTK